MTKAESLRMRGGRLTSIKEALGRFGVLPVVTAKRSITSLLAERSFGLESKQRSKAHNSDSISVRNKFNSVFFVLGVASLPVWGGEASHGFSYFGDLKYPPDMPHFEYVNPEAPKGGRVNLGKIGTFNNLNPYIDKGTLAHYINPRLAMGATIYEPLMLRADDDAASYYCRLAEHVLVADDYSWVQYKLRENAYWHDGRPVTMEDVVWTFQTIKNEGGITWKQLYREIDRLEQIDRWTFKFHFSDTAERTPQVIINSATFAPLPKHYWKGKVFNATTLEIPLGNGPYRITSVDPGYKLVFERVNDYWAKDLNVSVGHFNFDHMELTYFFDKSVMLQAMRAGLFDFYLEENEKDFATAYDFMGSRKGLFKKETYKMGFAYGMHFGVVFNLRRDLFKDIRVREALTLAYNFEWANRVYWHGGMARNNSYFVRSGLRASGLPSAAELEILEPFRGEIPDRVFTDPVELPVVNSFGRNRAMLLKADKLLEEAGWVVRNFERVNSITGEPLTFEFIVTYQDHQRMLIPFVDNLERLGIRTGLRRIEGNLMINRIRHYDFDATIRKLRSWSIPIPSHLRSMFTAEYADLPNMRNIPGIKNSVVDALVEKVNLAESQEELNTAGRALDRVLLHNFYVVPDGHPIGRHIVYWDRIGHPPLGVEHLNWTGFPYLWWFDEEKSARVDAGLAEFEED